MNVHVLETVDSEIIGEARGAFESIVRDIRIATDPIPGLQRDADKAVLLAGVAFGALGDDVREHAWGRLVRRLRPLAMMTQSKALLDFVRENADLL